MGIEMKRFYAAVMIVLLCGAAFKGDEYPKDYFRSPIGIPILLAGSFQELRSGHFHAGLDIKTNGKQGYRVYAAADGHVVRVKVSPGGYGNALYIQHPNGFTTAYGHLREFSDDITAYVRAAQYEKKSFDVDLFPEASRFPIKKGEVIALSGNSGSSGGPHLHFEIRETASAWPVNPLLFGIPVTDTEPPQIRRLKVYAVGPRSRADIRFSNGRREAVTPGDPGTILVNGGAGRYKLTDVSSITASGPIAFGIETRDTHNGSGSRLGEYTVTLAQDGKPIFEFEAEKFSFSDTRYINAHVDYAERTRYKRWVQRSYLLPGNRLPSYPLVEHNGITSLDPGATSKFSYEVADYAGNTSSLDFTVEGKEVNPIVEASASEPALKVLQGRPYSFEREGVKVDFDKDAFYDDVALTYDRAPKDAASYSARHVIHDPYTPVHSSFDLAIEADVPSAVRSVVVFAYENSEGKTSYSPARYKDGWVTGSSRALGTYYVSADTIAPRIRPINIANGKSMGRLGNIRFRISDGETGIRSYDGYVDGKWVLFEFDAKTGMLIHTFDEHVGPGKHDLQLKISDGVGNTTMYEATFTR